MVKRHRRTGAERHYRKNQKQHPPDSFHKCCATCAFSGRSGGDRFYYGMSLGSACYNKESKMYMRKIVGYGRACVHYKVDKGVYK